MVCQCIFFGLQVSDVFFCTFSLAFSTKSKRMCGVKMGFRSNEGESSSKLLLRFS